MAKLHPTIGCCGIDCGLCPRFYTKGTSVCPGCCGPDFKQKHPSCGFVMCCVTKNGLETCASCLEFPCKRFDAEREGYDSFVTHRKIFDNLEMIKTQGVTLFLDQQKIRIEMLGFLLANFDDGRMKNFYCLCCALLPIDALTSVKNVALNIHNGSISENIVRLRNYFQEVAHKAGIVLKLKVKI